MFYIVVYDPHYIFSVYVHCVICLSSLILVFVNIYMYCIFVL